MQSLRRYSSFINVLSETFVGALARFFGFLCLIYASKVFGVTQDTDVIYYTIGIATAITCFFTATNVNIVLPQFLIAQRAGNDTEAWNMVCSIFTISSIILFFVMLIGYIGFIEGLITLSHFTRPAVEHIGGIGLIMILSLYMAYLADLLGTVFRGYRNFLIPNIANAAGTGTGLGVYFLASDAMGPVTIAMAYLTVWSVQALILWLALLRYRKILWFRLARFSNVGIVLRLIPPLLLNQVSAMIVLLYPNYVASGLEGGDLTALTYARRVFDLIPGLFILPLVTAMAPLLSDLVADMQGTAACRRIHQVNAILFSTVLPLTIFVVFYADLIVAVIFGSKAYTQFHQELTADAMRWYFVGLMAFASNAVITRALVMTQNVRIAYVSLVFAIAPAVGIPVLVKLGVNYLGSVGVAVGYTAYLVLVHQMLGYAVWRKTFGGFEIRTELLAIGRPILFSCIAGALSFTLCTLLSFPSPVQLLAVGILYVLCYVGLHAAAHTDEYEMVKSRIYDAR
jgi:putative peptidoglycan lipid II flippase